MGLHYYTVDEFADEVGESVTSIRKKCNDGIIEAYKPARAWLIPVHALQCYVEGIDYEEDEDDEDAEEDDDEDYEEIDDDEDEEEDDDER